MPEQDDKCPRCAGCGKIANTEDGQAWTHWLALPLASSLAVAWGIVKPIACPVCSGSGKRPPATEKE
jgi:hypothetical protein